MIPDSCPNDAVKPDWLGKESTRLGRLMRRRTVLVSAARLIVTYVRPSAFTDLSSTGDDRAGGEDPALFSSRHSVEQSEVVKPAPLQESKKSLDMLRL